MPLPGRFWRRCASQAIVIPAGFIRFDSFAATLVWAKKETGMHGQASSVTSDCIRYSVRSDADKS